MDKISPVSTNLLYAYKSQVNTPAENKNNSNTATIAPDIVKKETADAAKAYAIVAPPQKTVPEKKSIDELKADLTAQGKVEGKDFEVEKDELASKLTIFENGRPVKIYRYDKDGSKKENFEAIQEFSYPLDASKGLKHIETTYGADGEFHFRTFEYDRDNSPYKDDIVSYGTSPFDLEEKLKADGSQFARDIEYNNGRMINKTTAFNSKTGEVKRYEFYYGTQDNAVGDVAICMIDKDGFKKSEIYFSKDKNKESSFNIEDVEKVVNESHDLL